MGSFEVLDLTGKAVWEETLSDLPSKMQDVFYTPNYYQLFKSKDGGTAQCFVFKSGDKVAVYPFLRNSVNQLGYDLGFDYYDIQGAYGYNGIVYNSNEKAFIQDFYKTFNQWCEKENIIAEFTRFHPIIQNYSSFSDEMEVIRDRETVVLNLNQDFDRIWENEYSSKNRNMIRKATKNGYIHEILSQPKSFEIDRFLNIYRENMQKVDAEEYYYFDHSYFHQLFELFPDNSYMINVKNGNNLVVASSVFFHYKTYFHYHLSGRTSDSDNSANNFLLDCAIQLGKELGASWFYLGGGIGSSDSDSLLKFKMNFSKKTLPFYIGKKIHNPIIYNRIIEEWESHNPQKKERLGKKLLRYRE